ncbi:lipase family protein [Adhaeribacter aquaticus]|uniref:lipase family protein n=1 Tax=Adhaeribacter aquaticus TaxID=299567 RepID=UPI000409CB00|nr:lipase family protein [Adhaeribacter aquaticus]
MKKPVLLILLICLFYSAPGCFGQKLKPGFNKTEFLEMLYISARQLDTTRYRNIPVPQKFKRIYRSPVLGLENRWDLWLTPDSVAAISIRGTVRNNISWLGNFYAAMVPAKGQLQLSKDFTFTYSLAENPQAAVHVGWLVATAALSRDIKAKIDSCVRLGVKDFYIVGHSQGGAIAYLLTSYVKSLQKNGSISPNLQFKTYCIAAPKPGNLFYAYEYEAATANGWAYNIVNSADWVPETPVTIQTLNDFSPNNPFKNAPGIIKRQKFPRNILFSFGFNQLDKPTKKALRKYQKYLGGFAAKFVKKQLPEFVPPVYANTSNYARAGNFIVLLADEEYRKIYPNDEENVFAHHLLAPYLYLIRKWK